MIVKEWFKGRMNLHQTIWEGLQYSLLSPDYNQGHPFVYCKEFILDAVWATLNNQSTDVYGFKYNPELNPVSINPLKMLVRNLEDPNFKDKVPNCLKFINKLEKEFGFSKTQVELCENAEKAYTAQFIISEQWLHAPPLLSLLTLMIRIGMIYNGKENIWNHSFKVSNKLLKSYQIKDDQHLRDSYDCIQDLIKTNCRRFNAHRLDNWPKNVRGIYIHEFGGIVSLAKGRGICSSWYKK